MRLDFFIANASGLSRKEAKRALGAGEIEVDGEVCRKGAYKLQSGQQVTLQGQPLALPGERYLMLHKPAGVVCSTEDGDHLSVLSLIPADQRRGLVIVGRLDLDTTGLLLLTTDGQWSHRVTSPRHQCPKTYRVSLAEPLAEDAVVLLTEGVMLRNDSKPAVAADVSLVDELTIDLTITEGRYHQVKRMIAAVGNRVTGLHRLKVGGIMLDPALAAGEYRQLTAEEIACMA
ncbi:pseudouridine synthase [Marinobacter zhejiangensis]|uniref:Pseudouridine synthase n=1 Tax=Marinobacter zhejiangensis TaxID=488535 RepID=A0A1I4L5U5_9GAMM|nr:pseudouridine synthase [Marinobacter zhejiangensis]SFL86352.1 16S rRNA pseudouridine516 synthase [Marinobacter zhejiangensis]